MAFHYRPRQAPHGGRRFRSSRNISSATARNRFFTSIPLVRSHPARGSALAGEMAKARKAYQDFLALWKDADPGIPILQQAKTEYAKLL
jgi:hypothetical protein